MTFKLQVVVSQLFLAQAGSWVEARIPLFLTRDATVMSGALFVLHADEERSQIVIAVDQDSLRQLMGILEDLIEGRRTIVELSATINIQPINIREFILKMGDPSYAEFDGSRVVLRSSRERLLHYKELVDALIRQGSGHQYL